MIISTIYRHPHALVNSFDYLSEIFKDMCSRNKHFVVLGDMNNDLLTPNAKLNTIINRLGLESCIKQPTRITETSASLLDVIITNKTESIKESGVVPCPVADHELVYVIVDIKKPKRQPEYRTYRCLTRYDRDKFCSSILDHTATLNEILKTDSVNLQTNIITYVFNTCINKYAPVVTKKITRPSAPWMNGALKVAIKNRDKLKRQLKLDRYNVMLQREYREKKETCKIRNT